MILDAYKSQCDMEGRQVQVLCKKFTWADLTLQNAPIVYYYICLSESFWYQFDRGLTLHLSEKGTKYKWLGTKNLAVCGVELNAAKLLWNIEFNTLHLNSFVMYIVYI